MLPPRTRCRAGRQAAPVSARWVSSKRRSAAQDRYALRGLSPCRRREEVIISTRTISWARSLSQRSPRSDPRQGVPPEADNPKRGAKQCRRNRVNDLSRASRRNGRARCKKVVTFASLFEDVSIGTSLKTRRIVWILAISVMFMTPKRILSRYPYFR